jgi:parallel beta-helix repeat protein
MFFQFRPAPRLGLSLWVFFAAPFATANLFAQKTIHVPQDVPTIQQAIAAASNGDVVLVSPGTYSENIQFLGKAIAVEGAGTAAQTIIDGSSQGPVVTFSAGEGRGSVLSNLTIQNGAPGELAVLEGGGVSIVNASPTIVNTIIQNNVGCGIGGFNSAPLIQGNTISGTTMGISFGCDAGLYGGVSPGNPAEGSGILLAGYSSDGQQAQIIGNTIENNTAHISPGGIYLQDAGMVVIENNIITQNWSDFNGAIQAGGDIALIFVQNLVYNNVTDVTLVLKSAMADTGAIDLGFANGPFRNTPTIIANNTIAFNQDVIIPFPVPSQQGTQLGLLGFYDHVLLTNNVIVGPSPRASIHCDVSIPPVSPPQFDHNDIFVAGNNPAYSGGCTDQTGSNGNISADPLFASTNTNASYPYQLQLQSPAVDTGNNNTPDLPAEDILGNARIQDATGSPTPTIDMGAYEYPGVPAPPTPADFALTLAPTNLTLPIGQQGTIAVTLTPTSTFNGTVTLSCSPLPVNISCTFKPQKIQLQNGIPEASQLLLGTVPTTAQAGNPHDRKPAFGTIAVCFLPGCFAGLLLFVKSRSLNRRLRSLLTLIAIACTLGGLSGCGQLIESYYPPANYAITVYGTASSGGLVHQARFTLNTTN